MKTHQMSWRSCYRGQLVGSELGVHRTIGLPDDQTEANPKQKINKTKLSHDGSKPEFLLRKY